MSDLIREKFEAKFPRPAGSIIDADGLYSGGEWISFYNARWEAWQAALAQQPAPAVMVNEQAEFEKWRSEQIAVLERNGYPDGAQAFYRLGTVQWSGWQARAMLSSATAAPAPAAQEPVAWGAFHLGGKRDCKLYSHADTEAQIDAYILDVHRSSDSITLRKAPLYAAPPAAEQPDTVRVPVETLRRIHRDLDACQKVIWLAGCRPRGYGFDPAYVTDAQARLKEIDVLLGKGGE